MPKSLFAVALVPCLLLGFSPLAAAQAENRGIFVDAGITSNTGWHGSADYSSELSGPNIDGTTVGGTGSIGTWLTPRFSIRMEFALLRDISHGTANAVTETSPLGQTIAVTTQNSASLRERTVAVMLGYSSERRHGVQLSYLGGAVFGFERVMSSTIEIASPPLPNFGAPSSTATVRSYGSAAEVGLDADVAIGRHVSLVPQARLVADNVSLRAGLAVRGRW